MKASLAWTLLLLTSCSKVDVYTTAPNPPSNPPEQVVRTVALPAVRQPSSLERVAEIDKQLAAPLTGNPGEADLRAQLRAERDALSGRSALAAHLAARNNYAQPAPHLENPAAGIVVAPDSQAGPNRLGWEALTPSEKKDYYKLIRASRPNVLIEDRR